MAFFFGFFGFFLGLVQMGNTSFASLPVVYKSWVTQVCLLVDTPLRTEVGGGITFATSGKNT